ncbi:hypothetical protein KTE29_05205, partial [Burkholderia multivorans]
MGTIINSLGYSAGVVDGNASVQGAAEALSKNPSDPGLKAAYDAAYANAVAAETALIPGVGAVFASSAIKMDLQSISINGANPSNLISLASNIAILASQGIALSAALAGGGEVAVTVGATTFALSELVDFMGAALTGIGVNLDGSDILSYLQSGANAIGLTQNSNGSYNSTQTNSSTFSINGDSEQFSINGLAMPSGGVYVPILDENGNITGFSLQTPSGEVAGNGGYLFGPDSSVSTASQDLQGVPNSPTGAYPIALWDMPYGSGGYANLVQYSDGSFGTKTVDQAGNVTVNMQNIGAPLPNLSNQVSMNDDNGQISASVVGSNVIVDLSNANVNIAQGATATLVGNKDVVNDGSGSAVLISGNDESVTALGGAVSLNASSSATINGISYTENSLNIGQYSFQSNGVLSQIEQSNASTGAELWDDQFNASGQETGFTDYAGTATNDYITNIGTLNTATGWESSDTSYNSAGQRTSYETYAGDANA